MKSKEASDKQEDESPEYRQLVAICETLDLSESRGQSAAQVFSQIQNKVGQLGVH